MDKTGANHLSEKCNEKSVWELGPGLWRERFYPTAIRRIGRDPSLENGTDPGSPAPSLSLLLVCQSASGAEGGHWRENSDDKNNLNHHSTFE